MQIKLLTPTALARATGLHREKSRSAAETQGISTGHAQGGHVFICPEWRRDGPVNFAQLIRELDRSDLSYETRNDLKELLGQLCAASPAFLLDEDSKSIQKYINGGGSIV